MILDRVKDGVTVVFELTHRLRRTFGASFTFALVLLILAPACIKRTVRMTVPPKMLAAKSATLEELLALLSSYSERVSSLSSATIKVSLASGKAESGKLQAYRSAPGYILLRRPDSIRLNIQNPVTKTAVVELQSVGNDFSIWYPRENKFFVGKNSAKELDVEGHPGFTARPVHIFEAILPQRISLEDPGVRVAVEEDLDAEAKYYVLSFFVDGGDRKMRPVRKLWVERSKLTVVRQQSYDSDGGLTGIVRYSDLASVGGLYFPLSIKIDRPYDGYSLDLRFKNWRLNPDLPDSAFILTPPPSARRVELKERGKNEVR